MTATETEQAEAAKTPFERLNAAGARIWATYQAAIEPAQEARSKALDKARADLDAGTRAAYSHYAESLRRAEDGYRMAADQAANVRDAEFDRVRVQFLGERDAERHALGGSEAGDG